MGLKHFGSILIAQSPAVWEKLIMKARIAILLLALAFVGCAATGHIKAGDSAKLKIGMTKDEVFKALGKPTNAAAEGNVEILRYIEERPWWQDVSFQVRIVDGKVNSYGPEVRDYQPAPVNPEK